MPPTVGRCVILKAMVAKSAVTLVPKRRRMLRSAVDMLSKREKRSRLARELAKLDPAAEKRMAEEGLGASGQYAWKI